MIPNQREYEIFGMGQTRIYIYVVMLPLRHTFSSCYLPYMETELSKKYLVKEVPHRPAQTEKELQWFKTSFRLSDGVNGVVLVSLLLTLNIFHTLL